MLYLVECHDKNLENIEVIVVETGNYFSADEIAIKYAKKFPHDSQIVSALRVDSHFPEVLTP